MLGAGALGRPRGMEWGGRREGFLGLSALLASAVTSPEGSSHSGEMVVDSLVS